MRTLALLIVLALDLAAAWLLLDARGRARGLELAPLPALAASIRGTPTGSGGSDPGPPPLFDGAGRLRLAALAVPGYDPPELRRDPAPLGPERLPPRLAELDGSVVTVSGYPLPADVGQDGTRTVLLSRNPPGCCFGLRPVLDEWIEVRLDQGTRDLDPSAPATFRGTLEVGEVQDEAGYALSLYRLRGASRVRDEGR